jgi:hypothetical protein
MGYPQHPGDELSVFHIFPVFEGPYHFDESFLKDIFSQVLVLNNQQDIRIYPVLVALN